MDFNNNLDKLDNLPRMIEDLYSCSKKRDIKFREELDNIYIMGDLNGRMAGNLLQTLLLYNIKIPIIVEDIEDIPGFINEKTLVFVIFQAYQKEDVVEKINRCAQKKADIICITEEGVNLDDIIHSKVNILKFPVNFGYCFENQYVFITILHFLSQNNLIKNSDNDLDEMIKVLNYLKEDYSLNYSFKIESCQRSGDVFISIPHFFLR